ncbi:hypothetical protein C0J52_16373 [Blattella germanica]|nr:hypothetical protein C0J52_16373 [Blattella germanica]
MGGGNQSNQGATVCKRCKNKVTSGVKCVDCESIFHPSCSKLVTDIIFINDNIVKCCVNSEQNVSNHDLLLCDALKEYVDENNKIDVKLVNYILYQKQVIINELRDKVVILSKHVDVLNRLNATTCIDKHSNENTEAFNSSGKQIKHIEAKPKTLSKNPTDVNPTNADISRRLKSTELESNSTLTNNVTNNKLRFNENSENNINNGTEETWAQVTSRRKQRKPEVIGTKGVK